jgi:hypothetical protein
LTKGKVNVDPATKLVILWPTEGREGGGRTQRSADRFRSAFAPASSLLLRWAFALLITVTFLFITACAALRDESVNARQPEVVELPQRPASIPVVARETPPSSGTTTTTTTTARSRVLLEEGVRERIATRLGVPPERLLVQFETPAAARLVLGRSAAFRVEPTQTAGGWLVVFDSIPGMRPELRLPLRAVLQPAARPMQEESGR